MAHKLTENVTTREREAKPISGEEFTGCAFNRTQLATRGGVGHHDGQAATPLHLAIG